MFPLCLGESSGSVQEACLQVSSSSLLLYCCLFPQDGKRLPSTVVRTRCLVPEVPALASADLVAQPVCSRVSGGFLRVPALPGRVGNLSFLVPGWRGERDPASKGGMLKGKLSAPARKLPHPSALSPSPWTGEHCKVDSHHTILSLQIPLLLACRTGNTTVSWPVTVWSSLVSVKPLTGIQPHLTIPWTGPSVLLGQFSPCPKHRPFPT